MRLSAFVLIGLIGVTSASAQEVAASQAPEQKGDFAMGQEIGTLRQAFNAILQNLTGRMTTIEGKITPMQAIDADHEKRLKALEKAKSVDYSDDIAALAKRVKALEDAEPKWGSGCVTKAINPDVNEWGACPTNYVAVAVQSDGITTGSKKWFGTLKCCPLKM